jgi:transcriptional regulator with XRE-family HTH domain
MSKNKDIGLRLKEERKKLGKNQDDFAVLCGFSRRTQQNYEKGDSELDELYLFKASELGADIGYILDGVKTDYDTVNTRLSALSKSQRLLNNPELIETIMIVNEVLDKTGLGVTDSSKFKQLLSSLADVESSEKQLSKKQLVDKLLVNMARKL